MKYQRKTTLDDVKKSGASMIFYGAITGWWTYRECDLYTLPGSGLPCDPRGGVLFQTENVQDFLEQAEKHAEHYGRHGLMAFEAALHGNVTTDDGKPTCFESWEEYNKVLDEAVKAPR